MEGRRARARRSSRLALSKAQHQRDVEELCLEVLTGDPGQLVLQQLDLVDWRALLACCNKALCRAVIACTSQRGFLSADPAALAAVLDIWLAVRRVAGCTQVPVLHTLSCTAGLGQHSAAEMQRLLRAAAAGGVRSLTFQEVLYQARSTRRINPITSDTILPALAAISSLESLQLTFQQTHLQLLRGEGEALRLGALAELPHLKGLELDCSSGGQLAISLPALPELNSLTVNVVGFGASLHLGGVLPALCELTLRAWASLEITAAQRSALEGVRILMLAGKDDIAVDPAILSGVRILASGAGRVHTRDMEVAAGLPQLAVLIANAAVLPQLPALPSLLALGLTLLSKNGLDALLEGGLRGLPSLKTLLLCEPRCDISEAQCVQLQTHLQAQWPLATVAKCVLSKEHFTGEVCS